MNDINSQKNEQCESITINIKKEIYDLIEYFAESFNLDKEEYLNDMIETELLSRLYDLKNFNFL